MKKIAVGIALFLGGVMLVCTECLAGANGILFVLGTIFGLCGLMLSGYELFH